ncbi:hypothetical protein [Actinoplanes sp. NPDC020271]|uniref:hypothetical protein n=1 Tax=Actinoplanes sp. NPDC020271 TaxID=3363896 RepID=UPI003793BE94
MSRPGPADPREIAEALVPRARWESARLAEPGNMRHVMPPGSPRCASASRPGLPHAAKNTPDRPSIVNGQIAAALAGKFGDVQFTRRTSGSQLFVNPLMAMYFTVDLDKLAARCLYLDRIENTIGRRQVITRIEAFRNEATTRIPTSYLTDKKSRRTH